MTHGTKRGGAGNFANDPECAREAGKAGGKVSKGNFKFNPDKAVEEGRKGGRKSKRPPAKPEPE